MENWIWYLLAFIVLLVIGFIGSLGAGIQVIWRIICYPFKTIYKILEFIFKK